MFPCVESSFPQAKQFARHATQALRSQRGIEQFAAAFAQEEGIEGCPDVLGALSEKASDRALREAAQADVGSLRAQGGRGFLLYHGARGVDYAIAVAEEGGEWKLASPEATPLP